MIIIKQKEKMIERRKKTIYVQQNKRKGRFISFVLYEDEKKQTLSLSLLQSFLIYLLVLLEAKRETPIFFFFFRNQTTPLAHHHYRLTGTRYATARYFHMYKEKKKKKHTYIQGSNI
jgi:hypothetical protein